MSSVISVTDMTQMRKNYKRAASSVINSCPLRSQLENKYLSPEVVHQALTLNPHEPHYRVRFFGERAATKELVQSCLLELRKKGLVQ